MSESNYPVMIGLAQLIQREEDPAVALGPLEMLVKIAEDAASDSGTGRAAIDAIDTIGIVDVAAWRPQNVARLVGDGLGIRAEHEIVTQVGGEMALSLVNHVAERVVAGESKLALVAGTNNLFGIRNINKRGLPLEWPQGGDGEPSYIGATLPGNTEYEQLHGFGAPTNVYPTIENALRARRGRAPAEHMQNLGRLMTRFTKVAAENPYAWYPVERSAEELITPAPDNRMIAYPYPKYFNAVLNTDQAAGALITTEAIAEELGVPRDKWLYWYGGAVTRERAWFVSERPEIGEVPALHECATRTLANAHLGIDAIDHIDFYSCFPVAVEMACEAYGVAEDDPRGQTVTGGLPYMGGPGNNYPMHSLVTMAARLRERPGDTGLVTGNGWYLTKHSANVWSTAKPGHAPTSQWDGDEIVGPEPLEIANEANGAAIIDSYTVVYGRDGEPRKGIVVGRLEGDGRRFVANTSREPKVLADLLAREAVGRRGQVRCEEGRNVFELD